MKLAVRAPATTANLGPGFDCAAVALDLWNELEITSGDGEPDRSHLGVRAFERIAPADGLRFDFMDRVPRERGLGSSASVIALGLVAGAIVAGREPDPEALLAEGVELEGHADNLAAALAGGVCLTWEGRIARIADEVPAELIALVPETTVATAEARAALPDEVPLAPVPDTTVTTAEARAALPDEVPLADAAFSAGRAALLGTALATGSEDLLAPALADRVHEPYRARNTPLLEAVRGNLPDGAIGATISGSGPTVIVWARKHHYDRTLAELSERFPDAEVLWLKVSKKGAGRA